MEPLNRLLAEHRGWIDVQVVHDRAFFDALATDDKSFTPTCGYDGYIEILRRCDIGLLPLNDTLFNRCKSDLKFIECAAHGVVALASPTVYSGSVEDGVTGVLFRTPQEFHDRLNQLVVDPSARSGIADRAYGYVLGHRLLAQHFRKRLSWYESLLDRKAELDARLFERVPELRP
nr:glycosyltransferase [Azospirillum sp. SYSU D00513]